jgi:hypothetical protein
MSNGGKVEIIKPFGEAFELMKKILFQPFDLKKWFVIGFAAFLSGHISGVNLPLGNWGSTRTEQSIPSPNLEEWKPWLPIILTVFVIAILILVVLFTWLKARGNFIFTDCIARNRAAIAAPWREYRREGNSYFLFLLLVGFGAMSIFGLLALCTFLFPLLGHHASNATMTPLLIVFLIVFLLIWIGFAFVFGVISYFMVPLMYVRRCRVAEAFRQVAALFFEQPGPFILFCLFGFCLLLGAAMVGGVATCLTCCLAALPYLGSVILLPVFVCLRAYGLFFIRQFGPDYDVWAAVAQSSSALPTEPPIPPPLPA